MERWNKIFIILLIHIKSAQFQITYSRRIFYVIRYTFKDSFLNFRRSCYVNIFFELGQNFFHFLFERNRKQLVFLHLPYKVSKMFRNYSANLNSLTTTRSSRFTASTSLFPQKSLLPSFISRIDVTSISIFPAVLGIIGTATDLASFGRG